MSQTGYYSRISNTVVSGSELVSALTGKNVRDLEFAASVANASPVAVTTDASLSVAQLIQATVDRLLVDPGAVTAGSIANLLLGPDAVSQSGAYCRLFNFTSTNQARVLKFMSTRSANSGKTVGLTNSSSATGGTYVKVTVNAGLGLFQQAVNSGGLNGGVERQVLVQASNLTSGSEVVNFTVLQAINGVNAAS